MCFIRRTPHQFALFVSLEVNKTKNTASHVTEKRQQEKTDKQSTKTGGSFCKSQRLVTEASTNIRTLTHFYGAWMCCYDRNNKYDLLQVY